MVYSCWTLVEGSESVAYLSSIIVLIKVETKTKILSLGGSIRNHYINVYVGNIDFVKTDSTV